MTTVNRPRRFSPTVRCGFGAGAGRTIAPPGPRRGRGASSSSSSINARGARLCRCGLGAKALVGNLGRFLLGLVFVRATFGFMDLARFRFTPFLFFGRLLGPENVGFRFGALALFNLDKFGFAQRTGAGIDLRLE